jgi:hypothetical protein
MPGTVKYNQQSYSETVYQDIKRAAAIAGLPVNHWIAATAARVAKESLAEWARSHAADTAKEEQK